MKQIYGICENSYNEMKRHLKLNDVAVALLHVDVNG
jgi:hypothetical protein